MSGLDTSLTELEDVESRPESLTPKLIAPDAFATTIPKPVIPASQSDDDAPASQPGPTSVTSSITSVTSMNTSLPSVNQLLGKSQDSENELSFKTCDEATLREQPSGFNSWLSSTSPPLDPTLPESPDPAKVPFPPFKTEKRGVEQPLEHDNISGITHSTPLRRDNQDQGGDVDKTPTAEEEKLPTEQDVLFGSRSLTEKGQDVLNPPDENVDSEKFTLAGGAGQSEFGAIGSERIPKVDRLKEGGGLSSFQSPVFGQFGQADEQIEGQPRQRSQRDTKYVCIFSH